VSLPRELKATAVKALLDGAPAERPLLLDVRNPDEHEICALPGALLIPLHELPDRLDELEGRAHQTIVVYCHHGVRSLSGAALLSANGFSATSLRGGIEAWSRDVDPTVPTY
jgi:rhodanese-related sulfurtransferase